MGHSQARSGPSNNSPSSCKPIKGEITHHFIQWHSTTTSSRTYFSQADFPPLCWNPMLRAAAAASFCSSIAWRICWWFQKSRFMTLLCLSSLSCSQQLVMERSSALSVLGAHQRAPLVIHVPRASCRSSWMQWEQRERYASVKLIKNLICIIPFLWLDSQHQQAPVYLCVCVCVCVRSECVFRVSVCMCSSWRGKQAENYKDSCVHRQKNIVVKVVKR